MICAAGKRLRKSFASPVATTLPASKTIALKVSNLFAARV